jgi:Xaa-Pro aminopeptidase
MVFVIEPQFRVPEERIYIRLEDMIIATEDGVEIYSDFLPRDIESIEKLVQQDGLLQKFPIALNK